MLRKLNIVITPPHPCSWRHASRRAYPAKFLWQVPLIIKSSYLSIFHQYAENGVGVHAENLHQPRNRHSGLIVGSAEFNIQLVFRFSQLLSTCRVGSRDDGFPSLSTTKTSGEAEHDHHEERILHRCVLFDLVGDQPEYGHRIKASERDFLGHLQDALIWNDFIDHIDHHLVFSLSNA
ncbi:hypothetical protein [Tulip streak virus]|uniref:Uncharacterized protein n=1 Tax=Tulip streak virus TaxID=2761348 RepID=A0A7R7DYV3_9VIRU|nr:hypothetical protein [Tulip streak virus]